MGSILPAKILANADSKLIREERICVTQCCARTEVILLVFRLEYRPRVFDVAPGDAAYIHLFDEERWDVTPIYLLLQFRHLATALLRGVYLSSFHGQFPDKFEPIAALDADDRRVTVVDESDTSCLNPSQTSTQSTLQNAQR